MDNVAPILVNEGEDRDDGGRGGKGEEAVLWATSSEATGVEAMDCGNPTVSIDSPVVPPSEILLGVPPSHVHLRFPLPPFLPFPRPLPPPFEGDAS